MTTIQGNLQNPDGTAQTNCFVRFWLRGCNGNQPRVGGVALIAPDNGPTYFQDYTPNASGILSGSIYSNDAEISAGGQVGVTWWGVQVFVGGIGGVETPYFLLNSSTFNLNSATPITTNPVVAAPTGDTTYVRIDEGNIVPFNIVAFSATPAFICIGAVLAVTFQITLTSNVTSSTLSNAKSGHIITFKIIEDSSGGRTFAWPSNVVNPQAIDTSPNAINIQSFIYDGTNAYPIGPGTTS